MTPQQDERFERLFCGDLRYGSCSSYRIQRATGDVTTVRYKVAADGFDRSKRPPKFCLHSSMMLFAYRGRKFCSVRFVALDLRHALQEMVSVLEMLSVRRPFGANLYANNLMEEKNKVWIGVIWFDVSF